MLTLLASWAAMVAVAVMVARRVPGRAAFGCWLAFAAGACALGALAIASQPLEETTVAGRIGSAAVHWGFLAGQGRLLPAAAISWLIWALAGSGLIAALRHRGDRRFRLLLLAWSVDGGALLYTLGVLLSNPGSSRDFATSLLSVAGALAAMIGVSAVLWRIETPASRRTALAIAGGPPLFLGVGYGLFLLVILVAGSHARWN